MGGFSSGKHWGVFGSIRKFWGVFDKMGVGWVWWCGWWVCCAPGGLCVVWQKNPPLRRYFPAKSPRFPARRKFPPRPAVLLSSTQPARDDFHPDKIKAPEEYPRGSVLGLSTRYLNLPVLSPAQIAVATFPEWWLAVLGLRYARKSG